MNEKDAWKNFTNSGSVNDYLRYASIKNEHSALSEDKDEVQHGRTSYPGTKHKGTRQGNHYTNKK